MCQIRGVLASERPASARNSHGGHPNLVEREKADASPFAAVPILLLALARSTQQPRRSHPRRTRPSGRHNHRHRYPREAPSQQQCIYYRTVRPSSRPTNRQVRGDGSGGSERGGGFLPRAAPTPNPRPQSQPGLLGVSATQPGPSFLSTSTFVIAWYYCQRRAWIAGPSGPFPRLLGKIVPVRNFVQRGTSSHLLRFPHRPAGPLLCLPPSRFCCRNQAVHGELVTDYFLPVCYSSLLRRTGTARTPHTTHHTHKRKISQPLLSGFNLETRSAPNTHHPPAPQPPGQAPTATVLS